MTAVAMTLSGHPDVFRACYIAFMNDEPSYHYHSMIGAPLEFFYEKELVRIRLVDLTRFDEEEKLVKFLKRIDQELKIRKEKFALYNVASLSQYEQKSGEKLPAILTILTALIL